MPVPKGPGVKHGKSSSGVCGPTYKAMPDSGVGRVCPRATPRPGPPLRLGPLRREGPVSESTG